MKLTIFGATGRIGGHLLNWAVDAGHDVHVYGASRMEDDVLKDFERFGAVTKLFQAHQYQVARAYDWYAGEIVQYNRESASIAEDLA